VAERARGRLSTSAAASAGIVVGLLVLVWSVTAGPAAMLSDSGRRRVFHAPSPSASPSGTGSPGPPNLREATRGVRHSIDLSWIGTLIGWALFVSIAVAVLLLVREGWRHRWHRPAKPLEVDFDELPELAAAEALRQGVDSQLGALAMGEPRNGIVRCWLVLEQIIAEAGLPRHPAETSTEFIVHVLHRLDIDPRAISVLAKLYREARFSEHELGEDARTAARAALQQLHSDLQELGAVAVTS
jgi:hypothetical protein